jgi:3-hydroxyisobutyrate dehydrogenase-like beta-hydroxyacid dehydrogenase
MIQSTTPGRIGFIGLGNLGGNIVAHQLDIGSDVTVWDLDEAAVERAVARGAQAAANPTDLRNCDVIGVCVPNGTIMRAVISDLVERGALTPGTVVCDFSTVSPADSRWAEGALRPTGAVFVDTPVGRTTEHALRGELLVLVGATPTTHPRLTLFLETVGQIVYCGETGHGAAMKLVNNVCNQTILFATLEALHMSAALGLEPRLVHSVLSQTNADNGHLRNSIPRFVFADDYAGGFKLSLAHKDIALALAAANAAGTALPVSGASLQAAALAIAGGEGDNDSAAYYRWLRNNGA